MEERELERLQVQRARVRASKKRTKHMLRQDFPGCPFYFRSVLSFMDSWLSAHLARDAWRNEDLARITYQLELAAERQLGEDAQQIKERGVGMWLRAHNYLLARRSHGMVVLGARLK